ncbi:GyrI-like domain-containing protein [Devosia sp.]|uniref:GyrI-like domain-containing protein n=1 Tax=Devosia sp. TaxID=1871048 RepID=UPI002FC77564
MPGSAIETVSLDAMTLVGLPVSGGWQDLSRVVPQAWHRLFAEEAAIADAARSVGAYVGVSLAMEDGIYFEFVGQLVSGCKVAPAGLRLLHIPANNYRHRRHNGPLHGIAATFQSIYDDAEELGIPAGIFKLDFGYQADGTITPHDLYIGIDPIAAPETF